LFYFRFAHLAIICFYRYPLNFEQIPFFFAPGTSPNDLPQRPVAKVNKRNSFLGRCNIERGHKDKKKNDLDDYVMCSEEESLTEGEEEEEGEVEHFQCQQHLTTLCGKLVFCQPNQHACLVVILAPNIPSLKLQLPSTFFAFLYLYSFGEDGHHIPMQRLLLLLLGLELLGNKCPPRLQS
jgi:hypothetical protein